MSRVPVFFLVLALGCASPQPVTSPQPTPNVQGTVQAAVSATTAAKPAEPTPAPPATATAIPPTPTPATPLVVVSAGAEGVSIRRVPGTGDRIRAWSDGAEMVPLGEQQQASGRTWTKVRDPAGNEGWVAAEFLILKGTAPVAAPAATPVPPPPATAVPAPTAAPAVKAAPPPTAAPAPAVACCRRCTTGKACGNSCIAANLTCRQPPGCACDALAPDDPLALDPVTLDQAEEQGDSALEPCPLNEDASEAPL